MSKPSPNLPAIVMIHGFRGTHHGLELIAKQLPDYEIKIPDLPGFGVSEPLAEEHDVENYCNWLNEYIKGLGLSQPPILLGHSFGSIVTACYAARHAGTISKLILVNPIGAPALDGPRAIFTKLAIFYYYLGRKLPSGLARLWLSSKPTVMMMSILMAKTRDKELRKFIHDQHLTHFSTFHSPHTLSQAFKASVSTSVRDFASQIEVPSLLVAGDLDDITTLDKQRDLVKLFPNAQLRVIKGVGHLTHYETPAEVAELVQDFIKD